MKQKVYELFNKKLSRSVYVTDLQLPCKNIWIEDIKNKDGKVLRNKCLETSEYKYVGVAKPAKGTPSDKD